MINLLKSLEYSFFILLTFICLTSVSFGSSNFIAGEEIAGLKQKAHFTFECPSAADALELCNEEDNVKVIGCKFEGNFKEFIEQKKLVKNTFSGKKERTKSFLHLKVNDEATCLHCSGYFSHPKSILLEGRRIYFEDAIFSGVSEVLIKPQDSSKNNLVNYIKLLIVNPDKPIYVAGRLNLKTLLFDPCEDVEKENRKGLFIHNANLEISLNK